MMGQFSTIKSSEEEGTVAQKSVLIVEDDAGIGDLLLYLISQETPYKVVLAVNGFQALDDIQQMTPSLFMLDYHLPGMTGIELADRLRMMEAVKHVPIIIMSARLPIQDIEQRNLLGMSKPFNLTMLLETVTKLVGNG